MAEIDPVILQLRADMLAYQNQMRTTTNRVVAQLDAQEHAVITLENQMRRSSGAIAGTLRGLAGSFASYLSVNKLTELSDGFTRLQNNLRIAGLEGDQMKAVQDRLFASAQKYGVEIEGLSNLYGQLTQASKELGASQSDIFGLTEAVSASLKITGISSQEAGGALLQLTQALRGGKIQAEEYNSLLDGLYPLLEAAAKGSDRFGGSVSKLTALVKDGKVSSQEFMQAILAGADVLEGKAASATLTLSAGYTTLNNALTVYFGEADKANGVSAALGEVMGLIAQNLDSIIPALASIAIGIGAYTAAATAASIATAALTANPVLLGISALAAGFAYLALKSQEAAQATGKFAQVQREAKAATDSAQAAIDKLATAHGKARKEAIEQAKAERDNIKAKLASAQASLILAEAEASRARSKARQELNDAANASPGSAMQIGGGSVSLDRARRASAQADANAKAAEQSVISLNKQLSSINAQLAAPEGAIAAVSDDDKKKKKGRTGPDAAEITQRYTSELSRLRAEQIQAELQVTTDAQRRAELQRGLLRIEYDQRLSDINATKEYSEERKAALRKELNALFGLTADGSGTLAGPGSVYAGVDREEREQLEREALDIATEQNRNERDILEAQSRLTDSREERRDLELRMLDLAYEQERAEQEAVLASKSATDAQKQIAEQRLRSLDQLKALDQESVRRDNESPLEQRRREVRQTAANMGDAIEQIDIDAVDRLADGLANASTEYIKLGGIAGDVINGIIQDLVRLAAKQALFGSNGGAGIIGSIGSFLGLGGSSSVGGISAEAQSWLDNYTPKGFATGGYTGDGPRNEVAGVVHRGEYVIPANAVDRIGIQNLAALTSGDTSAARAMTGVTAAGMGARPVQQTVVVKVEANDYFDARVDQRATQVAAPIGIAASAQARDAAGSDATRAARRRIPGR
ncbi:tape measure protein [Sphingobium yanoikuyae]|uniref:tape measure protein n=1 Tax=Sphingobium yanoikuyae TaxID=13690 RepID=UPI003B90F156